MAAEGADLDLFKDGETPCEVLIPLGHFADGKVVICMLNECIPGSKWYDGRDGDESKEVAAASQAANSLQPP